MSYSPRSSALPLGVAILAIVVGLVGFLFVLGALLLLILHAGFGVGGGLFVGGFIGELLALIFGIVLLVVASGLWHQELWALALTIVVLLLILVGNALDGALVSLGSLIVVVLLIYLLVVRDHFR